MADSRFDRFIRKPIEFKMTAIDGTEDTFFFKPLSTKQIAETMKMSRCFTKVLDKEGNPIKDEKGKDKSEITPEGIELMMGLLADIVMSSYPEIDRKKAEEFVATNFEQLGELIEKLAPESKSKSDLDRIKESRGKLA